MKIPEEWQDYSLEHTLEPPRVEEAVDHAVWRLHQERLELLGFQSGKEVGPYVVVSGLGSLLFCPPLGALWLALVVDWMHHAIRRALRGPTEVKAGLHRLTIERVGSRGRTKVVDCLWSEIVEIEQQDRGLVVRCHDGTTHDAPELGVLSEVRCLGKDLLGHAPAPAAEATGSDTEAADRARRAMQALLSRQTRQ